IYGDSDDEKGGKAEETTSKQVSEAVDFGEEKVEPSPAFQRFSGRAAEGAQADTTAIRGLAEIIDTGDKREAKYEYPLQKYTRLKDEVFELEHQLKQLTQSSESTNEEPTKQIVTQVNEDIKRMWGNVEEVTNSRYLTPLFGNGSQVATNGTVDSKFLMKQLEELGNNNGNAQKGTDGQAATAALTLYHDGSMDSSSHRLKDIAQRLDTLEALVGPTPDNMSHAKGGMTKSIEYLSKRLELLCDQNRLAALKRRSDSLKEALKEIKSVPQSTLEEQITKSKEHRINLMFEMMERWDQASQSLPGIVNRLRALKNLHQ
ncbi:dynactin 2-like protein, partial [Reticulomyxa filosa]